MQKEKDSLLRKVLRILTPSLFAIAVMVASFGCFSMVTNAAETTTYTYYYEYDYSYPMVNYPSSYPLRGRIEFTSTQPLACLMDTNDMYFPTFFKSANGTAPQTFPNYKLFHGGVSPTITVVSYTGYTSEIITIHNANSTLASNAVGEGHLVNFITNIPLFYTQEECANYLATGDNSGQINKPFNMATDGIFSPEMPIPQLVFDKDEDWTTFQITNAVDDYNIEIRGRWYSVDDIELYKDGVLWCHKYSTILQGELSNWITYADKVNSTGEHNLTVYANQEWVDFLAKYPVEERNYFGGTNAVGNYFSGYSDALDMLKMRLGVAGMSYTPPEIYVRFYCETEDGVYFSKWTHYMRDFGGQGTSGSAWDDAENLFTDNQSQDGLTDEDLENLEESGKSFNDTDLQPNYNNPNSLESVVGDEVWTVMKNMAKSLGTFPELVEKVFSFLPSWIIALISVGIGFVVILRFLGR